MKFGSEPAKGRRFGPLKDVEDDGNVNGDERLARFRVTSTLKRAARVTAVARSMTVTANPQVCQMLVGAAGKKPAACSNCRDFVRLKLYGVRAVLNPSVTAKPVR